MFPKQPLKTLTDMFNMGYCRFENTCGALEECIDALLRQEPMSERELAYAEKLQKNFEEFKYALEDYKPKNENDYED